MDLYEHQGKELFARYGIPTGEGRVADDARRGARRRPRRSAARVVVKAQVLAGGRGKAGGVKVADDPADADEKRPRGILGLDIKGHVTRRLWIEKAISNRQRVLLLDHVRPRREGDPVHALDAWAAWTSRPSPSTTPTRSRGSTSTPRSGCSPYFARAPAVRAPASRGRAQGRSAR